MDGDMGRDATKRSNVQAEKILLCLESEVRSFLESRRTFSRSTVRVGIPSADAGFNSSRIEHC